MIIENKLIIERNVETAEIRDSCIFIRFKDTVTMVNFEFPTEKEAIDVLRQLDIACNKATTIYVI